MATDLEVEIKRYSTVYPHNDRPGGGDQEVQYRIVLIVRTDIWSPTLNVHVTSPLGFSSYGTLEVYYLRTLSAYVISLLGFSSYGTLEVYYLHTLSAYVISPLGFSSYGTLEV